MRAARLILFFLRATALLVFLMTWVDFRGALQAQTLDDGARELARKVLGNMNLHSGETLMLVAELENHSSLPRAQVAAAFKAFVDELQSKGVQQEMAARPASGASVAVVFSENVSSYLWIAVVRRDLKTEQPLIVSVARSAAPPKSHPAPGVTLRRQFLWSQAEQILDVLLLGPPVHKESRMVVLEPERVVFCRRDEGHWRTDSTAMLRRGHPWARDVRGRLAETSGRLKAFLPGMLCDVSPAAIGWVTATSGYALCKESNDPWPVVFGETSAQIGQLSPGKNFFEGEAGGQGIPPRSSLAILRVHPDLVWSVATLLDGRAVLYENSSKLVATFTGWGSDIAALHTECGQGWQVLVPRTGDWEESDAVQAFEIVEREAAPVSDPVGFPGPVMALWTEAGGASAIAVSRNLKTGQYEAYELSITCGH